jgi:hypothetical protein
LFIAINNEKTRNSSPINLARNRVNGNMARILLARAVASHGDRMAEAFVSRYASKAAAARC